MLKDITESQARKRFPTIRTSNTAAPSDDSPARSHTEPLAPEQHRDEKRHLHKRLHSNSLRHRAFTGSSTHHYRHAAKETVQSAIELKPPISFDTLLRRDKKSPDHSRRDNNPTQHSQEQREADDLAAQQQAREAKRRKVRPQDVTKAKEQNVQREAELRDSLKSVEDVAMSSTRHLDDTYYNILEKASLLRNTVASLQQLAEESRRMHGSFKQDTEKLEQHTRTKLGDLGNFDTQETTIKELVGQLRTSKSQTDKLNERLEAARNRVEAYEQRYIGKQKTRRKQWGAVWATLIGFVVLVVAVIVAKHRSAVGGNMHTVAKVLDHFGNEIASPVKGMLKPISSPSEDPRLKKLFDEL